MAVSIALMFGRLGSIVGSNLVGVILAVNCAATFYLYTSFILGKFQNLLFPIVFTPFNEY